MNEAQTLVRTLVRLGLSFGEIKKLAEMGTKVEKLSRFDLPVAFAKGITGSTTVAASIFAAHAAKIKVFATGGIGGVHRGFPHIFDVSHDLEALSQTPIICVSSGAKAILDLPNTFEYLETKGILTVG